MSFSVGVNGTGALEGRSNHEILGRFNLRDECSANPHTCPVMVIGTQPNAAGIANQARPYSNSPGVTDVGQLPVNHPEKTRNAAY